VPKGSVKRALHVLSYCLCNEEQSRCGCHLQHTVAVLIGAVTNRRYGNTSGLLAEKNRVEDKSLSLILLDRDHVS